MPRKNQIRYLLLWSKILTICLPFFCPLTHLTVADASPSDIGSPAEQQEAFPGAPTQPAVDQAGAAELVPGNTRFAFELYSRLASGEGNLFFSPYSISTALAMTYAGARGNTASEMAATLHFTRDQEKLHPAFSALEQQVQGAEKKGIRLSVANGLWPQEGYPLRQEYLALTGKYYGGLVRQVDYVNAGEDARLTINQWVEEQTQEKIKGLLQPGDVSSATRLILVNAIYFKGLWKNPFKEKDTRDAEFHLTTQKSVPVPMMLRWVDCRYASLSDLEVLELPYAGDLLSMVVLLPREIDGVQKIEEKLTLENLTGWLGVLRQQEVIVYLPKFKTTSRFGLGRTLSSMGMHDALNAAQADFTGISDQPDGFFIGDVIHQAFVEVNEKGTEAAAATAVVMRATAAPVIHHPPTFRADHPFIFLIRENRTGTILFAGRLADPRDT